MKLEKARNICAKANFNFELFQLSCSEVVKRRFRMQEKKEQKELRRLGKDCPGKKKTMYSNLVENLSVISQLGYLFIMVLLFFLFRLGLFTRAQSMFAFLYNQYTTPDSMHN